MSRIVYKYDSDIYEGFMKILLLSYYFPPLGGAGVQRMLKFAKYLPEFDIVPIVISANEPGYTVDNSLLQELDDKIEVHRFTHKDLLSRFSVTLRYFNKNNSLASNNMKSTSSVGGGWRDLLIKNYALMNYPDLKRGWGRKAYSVAKNVIEAQKVDLIM